MEAADESGGRFRSVSDEQILAAQRELARRDGVFVEPASAAGVAGLLLEAAEGVRYAGQQVVVTVTGHGLKDIDTALSTLHRPRRHRRATPTSTPPPRRPGWPDAMAFVAGPVTRQVPATSANLGPGFDCLGLALDLRDTLVGRGRRRAGSRSRSTARVRATYRATSATWWSARCGPRSRRWAAQPPGLRLPCTNVIPHSRGLGSSSAAIVGGHRAGAGPGRGRGLLLDDARCSRWPPSSRDTPTTWRRRCSAGS